MKSTSFTNLATLLENKSAVIGIIGLGYVGLPLALTYAEAGFNVIGIDIDINKTNKINAGESFIKHIDTERIKAARAKGKISATCDFNESKNADALIICVPTPLNKYREPDLSFICNTIDSLTPYLRSGQILSLESTTYPGTTEEVLRPIIEKLGFSIGEDFFLIYSPEREDPGNTLFTTSQIPKVMGGSTLQCKELGIMLYSQIVSEVVDVSSTMTAEMTKLLENIHRAVNIGLMNELKPLADKMGIDLYEVIRAAASKPFGFVPYYPGPGLGGHCIPIDPFYLTWKAREYGMSTRFIELAGEINMSMPNYVVEKTTDALNEAGKSIRGSKILILGIAYKKNVDDMRESPSVEIMDILRAKGADIQYSDPFFPDFPPMRRYKFNLTSINLEKSQLRSFDAVILATDHDEFEYQTIKEHSNILIDTRGRYSINQNIIRA